MFLLSGTGAPRIRAGLSASLWAWPLQIVTGGVAVGTIWALWARRFYLARAFAAAQVTLILAGWGAAQYPYLAEPNITIQAAAAPQITLPIYVLFRIFKGPDAFSVQAGIAQERAETHGR